VFSVWNRNNIIPKIFALSEFPKGIWPQQHVNRRGSVITFFKVPPNRSAKSMAADLPLFLNRAIISNLLTLQSFSTFSLSRVTSHWSSFVISEFSESRVVCSTHVLMSPTWPESSSYIQSERRQKVRVAHFICRSHKRPCSVKTAPMG